MYQQYRADPRDVIRHLIAVRGIRSPRQLALSAGMSQSALSRYLNGETEQLEAHNYVALARELRVTLSELMGETPLTSDAVREVQRVLAAMSPEQQQTLAKVSRALLEKDAA